MTWIVNRVNGSKWGGTRCNLKYSYTCCPKSNVKVDDVDDRVGAQGISGGEEEEDEETIIEMKTKCKGFSAMKSRRQSSSKRCVELGKECAGYFDCTFRKPYGPRDECKCVKTE